MNKERQAIPLEPLATAKELHVHVTPADQSQPVHPAERHRAMRELFKLWEERGEEFK